MPRLTRAAPPPPPLAMPVPVAAPSARRRVLLVGAMGALGALGALALTANLSVRWQASRQLAEAAVAYQASPATPAFRLLLIGDSTALGTGAATPAGSLAGWIGRHQPRWEIRNLGRNGARWADLPAQLGVAGRGYDAVLVMCGGNDVIRLTDRTALAGQVNATLALAAQHARSVVVMPPGDVGHAPALPPPLSWWMSRRSRMLHEVVRDTAAARGAAYVSLLRPREQDPFVAEPQRLHAADGLHPSDAGYAQWYDTLARRAALPLPLPGVALTTAR